MTPASQRPLFITLEGIEGMGKSTHAPFVTEWLRRNGRRVTSTREPGGTAVGEAIRAIVLDASHERMAGLTELLLMFAARAEHLARVIRPALMRGEDVVCDRFTDATYAYQGGGRGIAEVGIHSLEELVHDDLHPDLTLLLDASVDLALERVGRRGNADRFDQEQEQFFERVRAAYLRRAHLHAGRFRIIDATGPIADVRTAIEVELRRVTR
jgi:dTMP kinase